MILNEMILNKTILNEIIPNKTILNKIDKLPYEMVYIIKSYIPREILIITNKKDYENEYMKLRLYCNGEGIPFNSISFKKKFTFRTYIKKILKCNLNYIFGMVIKHKYKHWVKITNYYHGGQKYGTYILFLEQLCIMLNSNCTNVIRDYEKENGIVRKKKHKKMRSINNTWTS